ncbi:hypothetical protein IFM89_039202, partial [Coptis chinensis]
MDFVVRPLSKINLEEIRARAGQIVSDQRRLRVSKNLQNLKSRNKRPLQAMKGEDVKVELPVEYIFNSLRTIEIRNSNGVELELNCLKYFLERVILLKEMIITTAKQGRKRLTEFRET